MYKNSRKKCAVLQTRRRIYGFQGNHHLPGEEWHDIGETDIDGWAKSSSLFTWKSSALFLLTAVIYRYQVGGNFVHMFMSTLCTWNATQYIEISPVISNDKRATELIQTIWSPGSPFHFNEMMTISGSQADTWHVFEVFRQHNHLSSYSISNVWCSPSVCSIITSMLIVNWTFQILTERGQRLSFRLANGCSWEKVEVHYIECAPP